jgi:hypothetical protein
VSDVHPDLHELAGWIGEWSGEGFGDYPTIDAFGYREHASFTNPPAKPFLAYQQRTWATDDGRPLHTEAGYIRPAGGGSFELVIAQPSGFVEIHTGALAGATIRFVPTTLARTPTAKQVETVHRTITVEGNIMHYTVDMEAVGHPLQRHLEASLRRVSD